MKHYTNKADMVKSFRCNRLANSYVCVNKMAWLGVLTLKSSLLLRQERSENFDPTLFGGSKSISAAK